MIRAQLRVPNVGRPWWGVQGSLFALVLGFASLQGGCDESGSGDGPASPDEPALADAIGVRSLRLLTRREYDASVRDLFFAEAGIAPPKECDSVGACAFSEESCVSGLCVADPCAVVTFVLSAPPGQYQSVSVAGSFNAWSATASDWAMSYDPLSNAWLLKHEVADGGFSYKFVADGTTWIADPQNPITEPDGFGGVNSILSQSCAAEPPPAPAALPTFSADLPVESRPEGFPFDDAVEAGLVTSVHAEQYFRAAERIADLATEDLPGLLGCSPASAGDPCVVDFIERVGRRAYRRALLAEESDRYVALLGAAPDVTSGVRQVLRVMLSSPSFLYRSEVGESIGPGAFMLTSNEIASALSYGFWGTLPDDALLDAAAAGELQDNAAIEAQARRLLADPRAREVIAVFAAQWLGVEGIVGIDKGARADGFDRELTEEMADETKRFVAEALLDKGDFGALFTADHTLASPRLAAWYGADASGLLPEERRAGLLAQGSVLASYAHSNQTSPVRRGAFVRRRLMCMELGTPPANAGAIPEIAPGSTTRERFEQHSADPTCASCHQHLDPIGFGFEGFDEAGAPRDTDAGKPVDTSGSVGYVNGWEDAEASASFATLPELGAILAESPQVRRCFATQVLRFQTGRLERDIDAAAIDALVERFEANDRDPREVLIGVTQLPGFVQRRDPQ